MPPVLPAVEAAAEWPIDFDLPACEIGDARISAVVVAVVADVVDVSDGRDVG